MMVEFALYAQLVLFAAIAIGFFFHRNSSIFHPLAFYLLFHGIVFVIRPFMVHYLNFEGRWVYMQYRPTDNEFVFTLFVTSVGLVVFALTSWLMGNIEVKFTAGDLPEFTAAQKRGLLITLLLLGPLATYSAFFATGDIGLNERGDIQMTMDLATGNAIYVNTTGYIVDAQTMFGSLAVLFMWRFRFAWWTWFPLILFMAYRAFLGGGRWAMITVVFTIILVQLYRSRRRWIRLRYLGLMIPLFILFQNIGFDRNYFRDMVSGEGRVVAEFRDNRNWLEKQDNPDFANFDFLTYILWAVPDKSRTYTYFSQYLQLFTEPIPRILWPDKPVGSPIKLVNLNDFGNFVGLTNSLVGDGWLSGGWVGVLVTMIVVGLAFGYIHRRFWRVSQPYKVIMYCGFMPLTLLWFRDGGISLAKYTLFVLLPILVWIWTSSLLERFGQLSANTRPQILRRR